MTDWPIGIHISAPNTTEEKTGKVSSDLVSHYEELCKRKPQNYINYCSEHKINDWPHVQAIPVLVGHRLDI